jgi:hypothetical protein
VHFSSASTECLPDVRKVPAAKVVIEGRGLPASDPSQDLVKVSLFLVLMSQLESLPRTGTSIVRSMLRALFTLISNLDVFIR